MVGVLFGYAHSLALGGGGVIAAFYVGLTVEDGAVLNIYNKSNNGYGALLLNGGFLKTTTGTATINFYHLDGARLVDLPGYGFAKVSASEKKRWAELIEGYFNQERDLRLVVMLIDSRHPASKDDIMMLNYLIDGQFPMKIVLTKIDKLKPTERKKRLAAIPDELDVDLEYMLPFSAVTGEGAQELRDIIIECAADEDDGIVD